MTWLKDTSIQGQRATTDSSKKSPRAAAAMGAHKREDADCHFLASACAAVLNFPLVSRGLHANLVMTELQPDA